MSMQYIELHRHSDHSYLDGCSKNVQFAQRAAELGMWALPLTDHGNINGALEHMRACEKVGIQPIMGIEAYYRPTVIREKEWQHRRWHLVLLAQNLTGWHNLLRISSAAYKPENFYQYPTVTDELLDRYHEGLICTTACVLGPLSYLIQAATDAAIDGWIQRMVDRFGDRLHFEIQPHDFELQRAVNPEIIYRAQKWGIPLSIGGDAHYAFKGWVDTQKIAILIGLNSTVQAWEDKSAKRAAEGLDPYDLWHDGMHLMSTQEVLSGFAQNHPYIPEATVHEAIRNNERVAQSVVPFLIDRSLKMPRGAPAMSDAERSVRQWCREGLDRIGHAGDPVYEQRLVYELDVIAQKKHWQYLYITADVVRWARSSDPLPPTDLDPNPLPKRPMRIGSSRGSAGGSLVCYCCRITGINPIGHKLKFERFLNPGRKGLPDIDIDFPDDRRNEIKEYVARKHGRDKVADVVAVARFTVRAALQQVARIMGIDFKETKDVTDQMDPVHDENLEELRAKIPGLDAWSKCYSDAWTHAVRLENGGDPFCKGLSKHAGGVIITRESVNEHMATIRASEEDPVPRTAWSETPRLSIVDDFGFVKWDFLSITGMTQQDRIVTMIAERTGQEIDLDALPVCDDPYAVEPEVMDCFCAGWNLGVNQFEGSGITSFLKRARPRNLVDLAASNALYRPGPMGSGGHNRYAKRKNGEEPVDIPSVLTEIIGDTYGSIAFQEQVMGLFEVLVGYTAAQADDVRKIIAKLYREKGDVALRELQKLRDKFIESASKIVGLDRAEALWEEILPYSDYSFNRAHASGYSLQAVQDMWLKLHYPFEFYAVLLTLEDEKTPLAIKEARHFGVAIEVPDVNRSRIGFTIDFEAKVLRYGLIGIDGIGKIAAEQIVERAPYDSIEHFEISHSFKYSKVNKGHRQALFEAGALDSLGARNDWTEAQKATTELRRLKMALRPGATFGESETLVQQHVYSQDEFESMSSGDRIVIAGLVSECKKVKTKRGRNPGQWMAHVTLKFNLDEFRVTFFPPAFASHEHVLSVGQGILVQGEKDDQEKIIAKAAMSIEQWVKDMSPRQEVFACAR